MLSPALLVAALLRCAVAVALLGATLARAQVRHTPFGVGADAPTEVDPAGSSLGALRVDVKRDVLVTVLSATIATGLSSSYAAPGHCRYCGVGRVDGYARERLVWRDPGSARLTSDLVANGVLPAAALLNSALSARQAGEPAAFWRDALVISEAAAITAGLNTASKDATARRRPSSGRSATGSANASFFSGHTSFAFSVATAAGTVSSLRGYQSAPWVWAGGMTLAASVGYLRVAGDAHWASDVAVGAAVGGLVGFGVPWFFHRTERPGAGFHVVPTPGGFGVVF